MKKSCLIVAIAIVVSITMFSFRSILIPNIEFDIEIVGTVSGTPTMIVQGSAVSSSTSPKHWSAYVDGSYGGIFNFLSNKCYSIKGPGGTQCLSVQFQPNYGFTNAPRIQYSTATKKFTILSYGSKCSLSIANTGMCCIYKADSKPK